MQAIFKNLKVGALVEIEVMTPDNEIVKLKTIIEQVNNESELRLFAPVLNGTTYPFRLNQSFSLIIVFKYPTVDKYDIYSCRCKIISKDRDDNISTITVKRSSDFKKIQRRDYFRLPLIKDMTIVYNEKEYELLSKDLSGSGVRGYISKKVPANSTARLLIETEENKKVSFDLVIISCEPDTDHLYRYDFRASFRNLKNTQSKILMKYIFTKQAESIRKHLNLNEYVSLIDSEKNYADFFTMTSIEKTLRVIPILLWIPMLVEATFAIDAFRDRNFGLNYFFLEFRPVFNGEKLMIASYIGVAVILFALITLLVNIRQNIKNKLGVSISLIIQILLSIFVIILSFIYT